jgi:hypothetical protein
MHAKLRRASQQQLHCTQTGYLKEFGKGTKIRSSQEMVQYR